jgi:hypothetical protein
MPGTLAIEPTFANSPTAAGRLTSGNQATTTRADRVGERHGHHVVRRLGSYLRACPRRSAVGWRSVALMVLSRVWQGHVDRHTTPFLIASFDVI